MNLEQLLMFAHVVAAIVWVGTSLLQVVLGTRVVRAGDRNRTADYARDAHWAGLHLYAPANLVVLASGLLLVHETGVGFRALWVDVGLGGWALSVAVGAALLKRGWAEAATMDSQLAGAALPAAVRRLLTLTSVDLAVLTGVVYAMTVKPTGHQPASLGIGIAVVAGVVVIGATFLRSGGVTEEVANARSAAPTAEPGDTLAAERVGSR